MLRVLSGYFLWMSLSRLARWTFGSDEAWVYLVGHVIDWDICGSMIERGRLES